MSTTHAVVRSWEELGRYERAWWELLARSEQNEPTLTPFWLGTWWRVFGEGGRGLRSLLVFDGTRLIGLVPLLARRHWYRPGVPFRRLELVGSGEKEEDEIYSEYLGAVAERGREAEVVAVLAEALASDELGRWDELLLPALRGDSATAELLIKALGHVGLSTRASVTAECPYISLPRSWEEYLRMLPGTSRHFVKRSLSSFEQWASGEVELREARSAADLEQGRAVLQALHGQRWSAAGHQSLFTSQRFRAFHDQVMPALLSRGALGLSWLLVRGEPVAALYNFAWNGRVYAYQAGRSLDVPNAIRPGIVAHLLAIRRAIEAGCLEYDFLGGATQYKLQLATTKRSLLSVRAVHAPALERVREAAEHGLDAVRLAKRTALRGLATADARLRPSAARTPEYKPSMRVAKR